MTPFRRGKSGVYSIYIPTGPGLRQRSIGTTDLSLAKQIEAMVKRLADLKQWDLLRAVCDERITIDELWEAYNLHALDGLRLRMSAARVADYRGGWELDAKRNAPATWDQQVKQVEYMLEGITYAHDITAGHVRDQLNALSVSSGTARHYLYALSSFCRYLVAHGALTANPCEAKALIPRPKKANKRRVWRTAEVDQRICSRLEGAIRIAAMLCCASSADRSTPFSMRIRDLQLLPAGTEPDPQQHREHRVNLPGTKAEGRARNGVRLEPWVVPTLREWIAGKLPDAPLVEGFNADTLSRHWKVAAAAERETEYWLRDTRHSYGCRALLAGYPLWEVSKWLGHANVAITAEIYLQFDYEIARLVRESTAGQSGGKTSSSLESTTTGRTTRENTVTILPVKRRA